MTKPANRIAIMPESLSASANTYGEYMNMSMNAVSSPMQPKITVHKI